MKSKAFRRKVAIISLLCIMMIVSLVSITVSWFKNAIDAVGPDINTGKIDVSLTEYHFDGTQWNSVMKYSSPEDTAEEYTKLTTLDSFSMDLSGGSAQDDVFYVIKKNEGSIPLDVSLGFVVDGYDAAASVVGSDFEVIGGFWYRLENVTEEYREAESYFTTGENNPVKTENKDLYKQLYLINSDVRTSRLDTDDVAVFRLTCGYVNHDNGIINKYNKSYDLNINFCVSQLGGLDGVGSVALTQNLQIEQTLVVHFLQRAHHRFPIDAVTGAVGHLMHIVFAVVFGDVQGTQALARGEDKFPLALPRLSQTVHQMQVAGVQADAQVAAAHAGDDVQQLFRGMGHRLRA